jgi:hypothetical protein
MDQLLDTHNLLKLNHEDTENLNRSVMSNEVESIIKSHPTKQIPGLDGFIVRFYKSFEELMPILLKLFQRTKRQRILSNSFYKAHITLIPKADKNVTKRVSY